MKKNNTRDFLLYLVVGGIATVSEWIFFGLLNKTILHYTLCTTIAYIFSTFINWLAGRILVFKKSKKPILKEICSIYIASIIGLLLNLLLMWIGVELLGINEMLTKIGATLIVFVYNFLIRKLVIYK